MTQVNHVSIELAKKLKEAGLEWEPKCGDFCWSENCDGTKGKLCLIKADNVGFYGDRIYTFLPSLSQLLAEIEGRGCLWKMWTMKCGDVNRYWVELDYTLNKTKYYYYGKAPEEATGQALFWILEQKGGQPKND